MAEKPSYTSLRKKSWLPLGAAGVLWSSALNAASSGCSKPQPLLPTVADAAHVMFDRLRVRERSHALRADIGQEVRVTRLTVRARTPVLKRAVVAAVCATSCVQRRDAC